MADFLRSTNPVLKKSGLPRDSHCETMTIQGTVNKTGLLLLFVVALPPGRGAWHTPRLRKRFTPGCLAVWWVDSLLR